MNNTVAHETIIEYVLIITSILLLLCIILGPLLCFNIYNFINMCNKCNKRNKVHNIEL